MKSLRVLQLVHESLLPTDELLTHEKRAKSAFKTEYDIYHSLKALKHEVHLVGVYDDLKKIKSTINEFHPHIVFNLLEEFAGEAIYDQNVVSFLELLKMPYTGCNPRGLMLARDKALTKEILSYHRIKVPKFAVFPRFRPVRRPKDLEFPLIVKCLNEEASLGISQASVVDSDFKLKERVEFLHSTYSTDVIAESFIVGREFYVGMLGNYRIETLPIWELSFSDKSSEEARFATSRVKFSELYRNENNITYAAAEGITPQLETKIYNTCKRVYRALKLSGYARIDLRVTDGGDVFVIEANPNPDIAVDEEFSESAFKKGYEYGALLNRFISLGLGWQKGESQ